MSDNQEEPKPPSERRKNQAEMIDAISAIVSSQKEEHEIKRDELALRREELVEHSKFACMSLEVQAKDRKEHRDCYVKLLREKYLFGGAMFIVLLVAMGWLVAHGQAAIATDILKVGVGIVTGSISGFYVGKSKPRKSEE